MKSRRNAFLFVNFKRFYLQHQFAAFLLIFVVLVGFFTGVFTGAKAGGASFSVPFNTVSLNAFLRGELGTFSLFWQRFLSAQFIFVVTSCTFFTPWFSVLGAAVICYRAFLLGLNITIMIVVFKTMGTITAVVFVFPFQLSLLVLQCSLLIIAIHNAKRKRLPFHIHQKRYALKMLFGFTMASLAICIIETLLLFLFSSQVVLVI